MKVVECPDLKRMDPAVRKWVRMRCMFVAVCEVSVDEGGGSS